MRGMVQVILIGQARLFREGLHALLNATRKVEVLGAYAEVEDAIPEAEAKRPDVILLHRRDLAGRDPSLLQLLRQRFPKIPVVLLLNGAQPSDVRAARQVGAAGCLDRHIDASFLSDALRLAAAGQFVVAPGVGEDN